MRLLLAYKSHPYVTALLSLLVGKKGAIAGLTYNSLLAAYNFSNGSTVAATSFATLAGYNALYYYCCWWITKRTLAARH
jgi:hypothetical protein